MPITGLSGVIRQELQVEVQKVNLEEKSKHFVAEIFSHIQPIISLNPVIVGLAII